MSVQQLIEQLEYYKAELAALPAGCLLERPKNGHIYYGHQITVNGKHKESYVRLADYPALKAKFDRRTEVEDMIAQLKLQLKPFKKEVKLYYELKEHKQRADEERPYQMYPQNLKHYTLRGEYVRSKSELNFADYLFCKNIDYVYEMAVEVGYNEYLHPDFSIFFDGRWIYIEHLGNLEDPAYARSWEEKKRKYAQAGIFENKNLICTREYNGCLNMQEIALKLIESGIINKI